MSRSDDLTSAEPGPYREGIEYVVCTECGSHILIEPESGWLYPYFGGDEDVVDSTDITFCCDWEPCSEDFVAAVKREALPKDDHDHR